MAQVPYFASDEEYESRAPDDWNIIKAALEAKADMILTGDGDSLDSGVKTPRIATAADFLGM
jgi:predicted nucleic acid-binding protein